ncbi:MAG: Ig-like domain-containing protein [Ekhidna sp.]
MKNYHTNSKNRLIGLQLFFFLLCLLIASRSEAQDVTPPSVVSMNPDDDATEIAVDNWVFEITFDEDIQLDLLATKGVVIRDAGDFTVTSMLPNSPGMTVLNGTLTMDFNHDGALNITPLHENAVYHIEISSNIIQDLSGNGYGGFIDDTTWNFATVDTQAPGIVQLSPSDGSTGILINESFGITFDEPTVKLTGTFDLYEGTNLIESNDINGADVTFNSSSSTSLLSTTFSNLQPETTYNLRISVGAVEDNAGNDFAGILDQTTWTFTTMDDESVSPVLSYVFPDEDEVDVIVDELEEDGLSFGFNEDVIPGSGNIEIRRVDDESLVQSISIDSEDIEFESTDVHVYGLTGIPYNSELYVLICSTCITDVLGNPYAGNLTGDWNFTTELGPLDIESLSPEDDAVDVAIDQTLSITFNQAFQIGINGASKQAVIRRSGGGPTFEVVPLDAGNISGNTLNVPHADFEYTQEYYVTLGPGVVTDLSNTNFTGITSDTEWSFTTEDEPDVTAPTVTSFTPTPASADVPIDIGQIQLTFDEPIQKVSQGNIIVRDFSNNIFVQYFPAVSDDDVIVSGNVLTMNLPTDLAYSTSYYVQFLSGTVADLAGNNYFGFNDASTWIFTTEEEPDLTGPSISSLGPEHLSTNVSVSEDLVITFDEDINLIPDQLIFIKFTSNDAVRETISTTSGQVSVNGNELTINPDNNLLAETGFYVQIPAGVVEDLVGNGFAGFNDASTWSFTTGTPLEIETVSPDFNSSNGHVLYLNATFNKDIVLEGLPTNRALEVYRYSDDQFLSFATVENVTVTGNQLEARLTVDVPSDVEVYVSIVDNRIKDLNDHFIEPLSKDFWKFTTSWDFVERMEFVPSNFSTKNPIDGEIKIVYAEDVKRGFNGNYTFRKYTGSEIVEAFDYASDRITIDGNEVIFEVNDLLEYNTRYFITMLGNPIRSLNDVPADGFNNNSTFVFTIEPDPALFAQPVTYTPAHMSTGAAIDTDISIEFSNPVTAGNGILTFYNRTTGSFIQTVSTSANMTTSGNTVTISLNSDLPYGTEVAVRVSEFAFLSENHGVMTITDNDTWYFTTEPEPDFIAPSIVSLTPADNATNVPNDTELVIEFDEEVLLENSTFLIKFYDNNVNQYNVNYASEDVVLDGNTITINLPGSLQGETHYWIQINANTITDAAGNGFPGILLENRDDWDFTTAGKLDQTITFEPLADRTFGDEPFTLSASASSGLPVTFDVVNGPISIDGNEVTILGAGSASIRADQEGNNDYNSAIVQIVSLTINKAEQVITIESVEDKVTTDASFNIVASVDSGLELEYTILSGPATISGSTIALDGVAGAVVVEAIQSGNGNYLAASATTSFIVTDPAKTNQTISFDDIADVTFGDASFSLLATSSSDLPITYSVVSGPVSVSGATISINGAGVATIAANQAGNDQFNPAPEVTQSFTIAKADQIITLESISDKLTTDNSFDVTASVNTGLSLTYEVTGPATISGTTLSLTGTSGNVTVTVNQTGSENYNSATVSTSFNVSDPSKSDQTITFEAIADKIFGASVFNLIATASSDLDVAFSIVSGPISINGNTVTIDGAGIAVVAANQAGDASFNPAQEVQRTFEIGKADQTITVESIDDKLTSDAPFDVIASVSTGLSLDYSVSGPASISGATINLNGSVGTVTVTVDQTGTSNYNSAAVTTSFEVTEEQALALKNTHDIRVYPNPVIDFLIIDSEESIELSVFDLNGREMPFKQIDEYKIDISELNPGMYILEVETSTGRTKSRIIKAN